MHTSKIYESGLKFIDISNDNYYRLHHTLRSQHGKMVICLCNNVNSKTIKHSIDNGARTLDAVRKTTGASTCCGKCEYHVTKMLDEADIAEASSFSPSVLGTKVQVTLG